MSGAVNDRRMLERIKGLEDSVDFFESARRREREIWIAKTFLDSCDIPYELDDIVSLERDPPDIKFKEACFEVKEILDPGRRRHDEYKEALAMARRVSDPSELQDFVTPRTIGLIEIFSDCSEMAMRLMSKYPVEVRGGLDLLFYFNKLNIFNVVECPYPNTEVLGSSGWRSVSFVNGFIASCFFAKDSLPGFLREIVGRVSHKRL